MQVNLSNGHVVTVEVSRERLIQLCADILKVNNRQLNDNTFLLRKKVRNTTKVSKTEVAWNT